MSLIISILIITVCLLLILIVLVQNSKGGGLASSFSSSNQVMGVRKTADFLEKATWTLAIALLALSLLSAAYNKPSNDKITDSRTKSVGATKTPAPGVAPAVPGAPLPLAPEPK